VNNKLLAILDGFVRNPGSPLHAINATSVLLQRQLPGDYVEVLQYMDGGEGFMGSEYVRLYPSKKLAELNKAYDVQEFAPGLLIFGSNGEGDAFAFDYRQNQPGVVRIPFIPMDIGYLEEEGSSVTEFLLSHVEATPLELRNTTTPNPELIGKEIHEMMPIVFGGSPDNLDNKVFLAPEDYAEYVRWWNHKYLELKGHNA
jgi:hypothetical protein